MKKRRGLTPEEAELWARVAASARRLAPERKSLSSRQAEPPTEPAPSFDHDKPAPLSLPPMSQQRGPGSLSLDLKPSLSERLAAQRVEMDRKAFGKLRRGKMAPDARIDLHGMTQAEAHVELTDFILRSYGRGHRLVLVITGKGGPGHAGILRQQVPHWLNLPPLRSMVLQLAEAHISHGGTGALYVYLRRRERR